MVHIQRCMLANRTQQIYRPALLRPTPGHVQQAIKFRVKAGPGNDAKQDNDAVDVQQDPATSFNRATRRRDEQTATDDDRNGQQRDLFVPIAVTVAVFGYAMTAVIAYVEMQQQNQELMDAWLQ